MGIPFLDWDKLVGERNAWVAHNFPDPDGSRTPLDSIIGCVEEVGELAHHHLKQVQHIRGDDAVHEAEAQDAIGDLSIYMLGVLSARRVRPLPVYLGHVERGSGDTHLLRLASAVGRLCTDQALGNQVVASICGAIVKHSKAYCVSRGWKYEEIVQATWDEVKQRDWIRYPKTGLPQRDWVRYPETGLPHTESADAHLTDADKAVGADGK